MAAALAFVGSAVAATGLLALRRRALSTAPRALRRPYIHKIGRVVPAGASESDRGEGAMDPPIEVSDDLFWLRDDDRTHPDVLAHLAAENSYTSSRLRGSSHVHEDAETLYNAMRRRMRETDSEAAYRHGAYSYYTRTEAGAAYRIECRVKRDGGSGDVGVPNRVVEEVLLDVNEIARGAAMCDATRAAVAPDHARMAYGVDFTGSETYTVHVVDIASKTVLESLTETTGDIVWGKDANTLVYLTHDDAHRPHQVWVHTIGKPQSEDVCIFTEPDEMFWVGVHKSLSGEFLFVDSSSKMTSEVHFLRLGVEGATLTCIQPRVHDMLYEVEHAGGDVLVVNTNACGRNGSIMVTRVSACGRDNWRTLIPHSSARKIEEIHVAAHAWAVFGREHGFEQIWVMSGPAALAAATRALDTSTSFDTLPLGLLRLPNVDAVYYIGDARGNVEWDAPALRFTYSSPCTPTRVCEYKLADNAELAGAAVGSITDASMSNVTVVKQLEVPDCVPADYRTARTHARAADGTLVPISIVYKPSAMNMRKDAGDADDTCPLTAPGPLLLYGYGSYGISMDMPWNVDTLALCDRGVAFAVAHVRGGSEMGRYWYEDQGRLMTKRNTFTDFISCAEHLCALGWTQPGRMVANGASAGGLLMGAVMNERPDLWAGVLSQVGFVDVLVTMSDPSIPLTVTEWEEWGNPNVREVYDYIRTYSPMENVRAQRYPRVLLTAGLNDYRVAYWEPTKFAQRLRDVATHGSGDDILLKVDMGAGHFSFTDRYARLREKAFNYAWVLHALNLRA